MGHRVNKIGYELIIIETQRCYMGVYYTIFLYMLENSLDKRLKGKKRNLANVPFKLSPKVSMYYPT